MRVSSVGLLHGPMNHYWYKFLDGTIVTGTPGVLVAKKVIADLSVSPFFTSTFIAGENCYFLIISLRIIGFQE